MSSRTIDNEVVELEFDNSKFEDNVKDSMSTLDKLKAKLNFDGATKGLDEIEKASKGIDFSHMENGIDSLANKFSVRTYAIQQLVWSLTQDVIAAGKNMASALIVDPVSSGWNKMDQMTGSVQTLVNSTGKSVEEITAYLEKLMWYSDETSFGFTDMTSALATMTSAGGDIDKLIPMIEGMANATAYAGKGAAEFTRVIYNLNQSYSKGSLQLADWNSVALAGVNSKALMETLIATGEELGKIQKGTINLSNFTSSLKDKWADTEVMEKAFNKFSVMTEEAYKLVDAGVYNTASDAYKALSGQFDEIAERAAKSAQEAKTFKEAIDSVKDAVSSKWLNIFATMFGDYNEAKQTWTNLANDLWEIFAAPLESLNNLFGKVFNSKWDNYTDGLKEIGVNVDGLDEKFLKFIKDTGSLDSSLSGEEWSNQVDEWIADLGSLDKLITSGNIDSSKYLDMFTKSLGGQVSAIDNLETKLEKLQKLYDDIWLGSYKNGAERVKELTEANIDYATAQELINKVASSGKGSGYKLIADDVAYLSQEQLIALGLTQEDAEAIGNLAEAAKEANIPLEDLINSIGKKSGRELLSETISNITKTVLNLKKIIGDAWVKVFNPNTTANHIYNIVEAIEKFTEKLKNLTEESSTLSSIFTILFSVIRTVQSIVSQLVRGGLSVLQKVFKNLNVDVGDFSTKVSDVFKRLSDWIVDNNVIYNALDNIGDKISGLVEIFKDWISTLNKSEKLTSIINGLKNGLNGLGEELGKIDFSDLSFETFSDKIKNFFKSLSESPKSTLEGLAKSIGNLFANIWESIKSIPEKIGLSFKSVSGDMETFKKNGEDILDVIKNLLETIVGLGAGFLVFQTIGKVVDNITTLLEPLTSLNSVFKSFAGVGKSISGYVDALKNNIQTNNIIKLALALGILAVGLWALAKIDSKALWTAIWALSALMLVMTIMSAVFSKVPIIQDGSKNFAGVVISLAASVAILALSVRMLKGLSDDELKVGIIGTLGLLLSMAISMALIGSKCKDAQSQVGNILSMAASVLIMSIAMNNIAKLADGSDKWKIAFAGLAECAALLAGIAVLMSIFPINKGTGLEMIAFAGSILLLSIGMSSIAKLSDAVWKVGLDRLLVIFGGYLAIALLLKGASTTISGAGVLILAMSASLILLSVGIRAIASIGDEDIEKAADIVKGLMVLLTGMVAVISIFSGGAGGFRQLAGIGVLIIALTGSLYLIVGAILILKNLNKEDVLYAAAILSGLMLVIGGAIALMNLTHALGESSKDSAKMLISFAIVIGVVAAALFVLTSIDQNRLLASAIAIVGVITSLTLMALSLSLLSKNVGKAIAATLLLIVLLGSVVGAFYLLTKIPWDQGMKEKVIAMGAIIAELSIVSVILSAAALIAGAAGLGIVNLLGLLAGVELLVIGAMALVNLIPDDGSLLSKVEMLCTLLQVIGQIALPLSAAALIAEAAGPGVLVLIGLLGGIETLIGITIAIAQAVDPETIDRANLVMSKVGEGIGAFFGNIVGGWLEGATSTLPEVGKNLSDFMANMTEFFSCLSEVESMGTSMDTFTNVVEVIKSFAGAKSDLKKITQSTEYLEGAKDFFTQYGEIVVDFSNSISGKIDSSAVQAAAEAGTMMAELSDSIPSTGGLFKIFTGEKSLDDFGKQMSQFAGHLVTMSNELTGEGSFDQSTVDKAKTAGDIMVELANALPTQGGVVGFFTGGHDLGEFGSQISQYATDLVSLCTIISEANIDTGENGPVAIAKSLGETLIELANSVPESGSLKSLIMGGNHDLGSFGEDIKTYAQSLVDMATIIETAELTDTAKEKATLINDVFTNIFNSLPSVVGTDGAIVTIGEEIKSKLTTLMDEVLVILDIYNEAVLSGKNTLKGLLDGLKDKELLQKIREAGTAAADAFNESYKSRMSISSPSKLMKKDGEYTIQGLINGIKDKFVDLKNAGTSAASILENSLFNSLALSEDVVSSNLNPVISPVLDLTDVENGSKRIGGLFNGNLVNPVIQNGGLINSFTLGKDNLLNGYSINQPTINIDFSINNEGKDITDTDISKWSDILVERINDELGKSI